VISGKALGLSEKKTALSIFPPKAAQKEKIELFRPPPMLIS
jgi:hypothetical protein